MKVVYLTAKMIQIIIVHDLQLTSAWIRSWKTRAEHCILLFSLFYAIKEIVLVLCDFFQNTYTEPVALFMKFPNRV